MTRCRDRLWGVLALLVVGLGLAGAGVLVAVAELEAADKIASVIGAAAGVLGLGVSGASAVRARRPDEPDRLPWVSMTEELGWPPGLVGFPRLGPARARRSSPSAAPIYRARDLRSADQPSFTVTEKARSWQRWPNTGDAEPVRVTIEEAAALQSFPAGHPWAGARSKIFQQIGNAIPPVLTRAVLVETTT